MKKIVLLLLICIFDSAFALADYPENEAEFLYNHNDNSSMKTDYLNLHTYMKAPENMYYRDDGVIIYKEQTGFVKSTEGKTFIPIGKMYIEED